MSSTALGGISVHHRDLHPGSSAAWTQRKFGNDSGIKTVHSGESNTRLNENHTQTGNFLNVLQLSDLLGMEFAPVTELLTG